MLPSAILRYSTCSPKREAQESTQAVLQSPIPSAIPIPKMSPELAKVLLQNVQAFEENALSAKSGDGAPRPQTPVINCGTIPEDSAEADLTGSNM